LVLLCLNFSFLWSQELVIFKFKLVKFAHAVRVKAYSTKDKKALFELILRIIWWWQIVKSSRANSNMTPARTRHLTKHCQRLPFVFLKVVNTNVVKGDVIGTRVYHVVSSTEDT
jgi:hypothetical protein